ncbi:MAG: glycoside hydrolase family 97 protein [Paludibacteraceae bacterium]
MRKILIILFFCAVSTLVAQKHTLTSPDGKMKVEVSIGKSIQYAVFCQDDNVILPSAVSMKLTDNTFLGINPKMIKVLTRSVKETINTAIYKKKRIENNYNELTLRFKGDYSLIFRAYNDGVAYRFTVNRKQPFNVESEQATFNFPESTNGFIPFVNNQNGKIDTFEKQFYNSFENTYQHIPLTEWDEKRLAFLPLVAVTKSGTKICISESDLLNYPGMFLNNNSGGNGLYGVFAAYPKEIVQGGYNMLQGIVQSREPYIAKCAGNTSFPWRLMVISKNDADLANSDMVYKLASPSKVTDTSWIKPGKVAWDWWNNWNLRNVDFKAGINTETYKYYIDFASKFGIEYIILDEGWAMSGKADLFQIVPEINLDELVSYAKSKNVGLILWAGYAAFNRDMEKVCKHYSEMGIKGFKIDFMDRDDQIVVDFLLRAAQATAKYHLLADFHGVYKPAGLNRTYPNVINFEGVHGLEQMKWATSTVNQVEYDVTIPFIRMLAGPMDYTQGAMRNAIKANYYPCWSEPMSQGTRCHQLAEYVVFESPLNMLCDNPSNYLQESECTKFIASVPTVWDETQVLNGEIGKYVTIARKRGSDWYVGALTNWDERSLELNLSFLNEGNYQAEIFKDGINANTSAQDYKKETINIPVNKRIKINLASGGGFVMKIFKK